VAQAYDRAADRLDRFVRQGVAPGNRHSYVHWVAQVPARETLARRLAVLGVETKPYFPAQHLHHEVPAVGLHLPVTERLDREALAFPMSSELSDHQAETVAAAIEEASEWNRDGADMDVLTRRCDA
jgi:dTDP-4-amino-4,6-dideoxygalactose transaminase